MIRKVVIQENERGLLTKNGMYIKLLGPGKYYEYGEKEIEILDICQPLESETILLPVLLKDQEILSQTVQVEVKDEEISLHYINGNFREVLPAGRYAFWNVFDQHEFRNISVAEPEVAAEVPEYIFRHIPIKYYTRFDILEYEKGRLYFDNQFVRLLEPGAYYFWNGKTRVKVDTVDTRLQQMDIAGQEILTHDKVALRINFICKYRITDYISVKNDIDNYREQLHVAAQLALREYVGKYRLDEILEDKEGLTRYALEKLKSQEKDLFIEIADAGVKDIILPGEIRDIMNTVLIAEKRAQANVITRREEVASTRSLLNTARLMEENKTLYKLKEMEYLQKICENVGNITVGANENLLTQLAQIVGK